MLNWWLLLKKTLRKKCQDLRTDDCKKKKKDNGY